MHKDIALIIQKIIITSPYNSYTCEIFPTTTNGFWKLNIMFTERNSAHTVALINILHDIGTIFGESLSIKDDGEIINIE